jgi:GNAT superfamily N-acetyltransferase
MADVSVRPARGADAPGLAAVQVACWLDAYAAILPAAALSGLASSTDALTQRWKGSAEAPPSPRHRVLVACAGARTVGGAALAPALDQDLDPDLDAELLVLLVAPGERRAGHASRLLSAAVDHLRADGFGQAVLWVDGPDQGLPALLTSSGWAPDGFARELDLDGDGSVVVRQQRWHTDLTVQEEHP